ncbi:hypothetical protein E1H18_1280 [Caulobacter sp. RHG1]|nr:hypothetical protein [Caulobacter sp. RHG1]
MAPQKFYDRAIVRRVDIARLRPISDAEADAGEDIGLEGNQQYRDLRGISWDFVAEALKREQALFERFAEAADLEHEARRYAEELDDAVFPEEDLWGLDVGVIGAVMALSALGVLTVNSCNAGGFGGVHVERFPLVAMSLPAELAGEVLAIAESADVGLDMIEGGLVLLYGQTDYDLHRFGQAALARHLSVRAADENRSADIRSR